MVVFGRGCPGTGTKCAVTLQATDTVCVKQSRRSIMPELIRMSAQHSPGREACAVQHTSHNPSYKGCTIELTHVLWDRNEFVDKKVAVADHVFVVCLHTFCSLSIVDCAVLICAGLANIEWDAKTLYYRLSRGHPSGKHKCIAVSSRGHQSGIPLS